MIYFSRKEIIMNKKVQEFMEENNEVCMQDLLQFICETIAKHNSNINISTRVKVGGRSFIIKFEEHSNNTIDIAC